MPAEAELLCYCRPLLGIAWCGHRMLGREFPARPIRGDIEPVPYPEMAAKD